MEFGIFSARTSSSRQRCCVETCGSRSDKNLNLRYHIFPKENESFVNIVNSYGTMEKIDRYKAWKMAVNINDVTRSTRVCSLHFARDDYILPDIKTSRRHLKKTAIPMHNLKNQDALKNCITDNIIIDKKKNQVEISNEEIIVPEKLDIEIIKKDPLIVIKEESVIEKKNNEDYQLMEITDNNVNQELSKTCENISTNSSLNQIFFTITPNFIQPTYIAPTFLPQKTVKDAEAQVNTDDIVPRFVRFITNDTELKIATGIESFNVLNTIADLVKLSNDNKFEQTSSRMNTKDRIIMTCIWLKQDLSYCFLAVMFKAYSAHRCQQVVFNMIKVLAECLKNIAAKPIHRFNKKKQIFRLFESKLPTRLVPIANEISTVISAILNLNSPNSSDDNDNSEK